MKEKLSILIFLAVATTSIAQVPQLMEYTAILRDSTNAKVVDRGVSLRLSVVPDTIGSQVVFQEVHTDTTDAVGLISVQIGDGTAVIGSMDSIHWSDTSQYLRTEVDLNGGTDYQVTGYTRMLSVPYALYAGRAGVVDTVGEVYDIDLSVSATGDTLYFGTGGSFVVVPGLSPPGPVSCNPDSPMVIDTVTSAGGKVWMDRNLGASQVATASDDSLSYGDLYQWGRFSDGHQCRGSDTTSQLATTSAASSVQAWYGKFIVGTDWLSAQDDNLWQGVNGTNNPCPEGFRLPTEAEWDAELKNWGSNYMVGAFASPLKLPGAGYRFANSGKLVVAGSYGSYWSSSVSYGNARNLFFSSNDADLSSYFRAGGNSVRCIKD